MRCNVKGNVTLIFTIYLTSDVGVNVSPYVQTEVTIIDDEYDDDSHYEGNILGLLGDICTCIHL